jgi:hypothetical protein
MITMPDEYADLFDDIRSTLICCSRQDCVILALNSMLEDILSNRNIEDWYYTFQRAHDQLQKVMEGVK